MNTISTVAEINYIFVLDILEEIDARITSFCKNAIEERNPEYVHKALGLLNFLEWVVNESYADPPTYLDDCAPDDLIVDMKHEIESARQFLKIRKLI